jgi:hypothetical protein
MMKVIKLPYMPVLEEAAIIFDIIVCCCLVCEEGKETPQRGYKKGSKPTSYQE